MDVQPNPAATYIAPETLPTGDTCRQLFIPDDPIIIAAVHDALARLTLEGIWLSSDDVEEWQIRALMAQMLDDFFGSVCP